MESVIVKQTDVSEIPDYFHYVYMPEDLDLTKYFTGKMAKYIDDAKYFVHKVYDQKAFNRRRGNLFTPLKAEFLRKIISFRYYDQIRKTLLDNEIIICDGFYVKGNKAYSYAIHHRFRKCKVKKVYLRNNKIIQKRFKVDYEFPNKDQYDVHYFLRENLNSIEIDFEKSYKEIESRIDLDEPEFERLCINKIRNKEFFQKLCRYGRVHTNITNLRTEFREHLLLNGNKLCEIDICNSQPYFLGILLKIYFNNNKRFISFNWSLKELLLEPEIVKIQEDLKKEIDRNISSNKINKEINNIISSLSHSLRCDNLLYPSGRYPVDVNLYLELVSSGKFYEYISDKMNIQDKDRKQLKEKIFTELFFGKNYYKNNYYSQLFNNIFPTVFSVIQEVKKKNYRFLSRALQNLESAFIINRVVRKCMENNIWVLTIHDSLLTKPQDVELVKNILISELSETGLIPTLKIK